MSNCLPKRIKLENNCILKSNNCSNVNDNVTSKEFIKNELLTKTGVQSKPHGNDDDINDYNGKDLKCNDFFGLSNRVRYLLKSNRNICKLYDWQNALMKTLINNLNNFIYCVPTSGGKTLVAELLILRELLINQKNALLILPFISLVHEKVKSLTPFALDLNFVIDEYAGSKGNVPPKKRRKFKCLYIATIEKAHLLLSSLLETRRLNELGLIVIDELHMLGEGKRGGVLETLIVKTKLAQMYYNFSIRILGMSATLSNIDQIAKFLKAHVYKKDYRPVELKEYVKLGRGLFEVIRKPNESPTFKLSRKLNYNVTIEDPEGLHHLIEEVMPNTSCLIFCPTKKHCENICTLLSKSLSKSFLDYFKKEKMHLIKEICLSNSGKMCSILTKSIPFGVAYHHSGLTSEERELIENAFLSGVLSCIVCTSTLAAGVNLPAQRVIIRSPYIGNVFLTSSRYKQMSGRAGRAGLSSLGESILMITATEREKVKELFDDPINECYSSLKDNNEKGLSTLLLTLFDLNFAQDLQSVKNILSQHTLFGIQFSDDYLIQTLVQNCFTKLIDLKLIEPVSGTNHYNITCFGKGAIKGLIDIDHCKRIYFQLKEISNSISLTTHLHLIYISTLPYKENELPIYPEPCKFFDSYLQLSEDEIKSAHVIGIKPGLVTKYRQTGIADEVCKRFYITMIVYDAFKNSSDLNDLSLRYNIHRGTLQSLLHQVASNAHSLLRFVKEIDEFWAYKTLFPEICQRLSYCCIPELIPLLDLPFVKLGRAKLLYNAGYQTITDIARAKVDEIVKNVEHVLPGQARMIISGAKKILIDQADELHEKANHLTTSIIS